MVRIHAEQHEVASGLCDPTLHCFSCNVDEDGPAYIGCFECGHLYRTAGDLRHAYRLTWNRMLRTEWPKAALRRTHPVELVWGWLRSRFCWAGDVSFCQECLHDF